MNRAPCRIDRRSKFLVIARIGGESLHGTWLRPVHERGFDLLLSAYDRVPRQPREPGVIVEHRPGSKVAALGEILDAYEDQLRCYRYVALLDDDLEADAGALTRVFEIAEQFKLKLCQPSLTTDSYFTYAALIRNPAFMLRYVNYVEMMCPVFRTDYLLEIKGLFKLGYESGIDLVWCNTGSPIPTDFAVIDAVAVRHTRPVGARKQRNGFTEGRVYEDDIYAVLDRFDIPWLSCVPYSARRPSGALVRSRILLTLSTIWLVTAIPRRRAMLRRARQVAAHWNHMLRRRPRNVNVPLGFLAAKSRQASPLTRRAEE